MVFQHEHHHIVNDFSYEIDLVIPCRWSVPERACFYVSSARKMWDDHHVMGERRAFAASKRLPPRRLGECEFAPKSDVVFARVLRPLPWGRV